MKVANTCLERAARVLTIEASAIEAGRDRLDARFERAVELILEKVPPGRVAVLGVGKSGHVGNKIAATLASTGTPSFFVHPAEAGHGDLGSITRSDVAICISQSGRSDEILRVIPYFKRNGIAMIAFTGAAGAALAQHSDVVVDTSVESEACPLGLAPTASTTLTLALGDALAMCLHQARGFSEHDFASTHPHGALGRRLLVSVADVMVGAESAPAVLEETTVRDALNSMSKGGLGFVSVLDGNQVVTGVFTDGDLRRALDRDLDIRSTKISSAMVRSFVSVRPDQLAVEAVDVMEKRKVSAVPVCGPDGRLLGALNMRLLLQAGVV